jgi:toxin-antitoxin system PIN domain toxin
MRSEKPKASEHVRALLDVNVSLALLDRPHVQHGRARRWLDDEIHRGWASCVLTQNGFVRIISQSRYGGVVSTSAALEQLDEACSTDYHEFWACSLNLLDRSLDRTRILGPRQLTDAYLLALAVHHGGRFVTLDTSVPRGAVPSASAEQLVVI